MFIKTINDVLVNTDHIQMLVPQSDGTHVIFVDCETRLGKVSAEEFDRFLKAQETPAVDYGRLERLSRSFLESLSGIVSRIPTSIRCHY